MGKRVEGIPTKNMSREEWLDVRSQMTGIGGSEAGIILGLNEYKSPVRLFYEKVGLWEPSNDDNIHAFMGRFLENSIIRLWQHYGGSDKATMHNFDIGHRPNRSRHRNYLIRNPQFPFLFGNIDNEILQKDGKRKRGVLEIKTISGYVADKWEAGVPPYYIAQIQLYMLVTGYDYSEIVLLRDGKYLEVLPIPASDSIQNRILEDCHAFIERVQAAKTALKGVKNRNERLQVATEFEPPADASMDCAKFYSERHKEKAAEIEQEIPQDMFEKAVRYEQLKGEIGEKEKEKQLVENQIKEYMGGNGIAKLKWEDGYITWRSRFTVKFK